MSLGEKICNLRKSKNLTQEELGDLLKVSRQSVSKWESDMAYPETNHLIELSKIFNCSMDYLLKDEENINTDPNKKDNFVNFIKKHWRKIFIVFYICGFIAILTGIIMIVTGNSYFLDVSNQIDLTAQSLMIAIGSFVIGVGALLFIVGTILLIRDIKINKNY